MENIRSVKIDENERGGWSSDDPSKVKKRPLKVDVRNRQLAPQEKIKYNMRSLVVVCGSETNAKEFLTDELLGQPVYSKEKLVSMIKGFQEGNEAHEEMYVKLLMKAVEMRLNQGKPAVVTLGYTDNNIVEQLVKIAAKEKAARHFIFLDANLTQNKELLDNENVLLAVNNLRTKVDNGLMGDEGFHTSMRLNQKNMGMIKEFIFGK